VFSASLPESYRRNFGPAAVAQHAGLARVREGSRPEVGIFPSDRPGTALCVVADDQPGLLATISAAFVLCELDVIEAEGYESEAIDAAMARLVAQRYIDDEAFARSWLNHRERLRPRGARGLSYELRQKGIEREIINEVLTELDEEASAWAAIEGKRHRWRGLDQLAFRKKVTGFLSRRGFSYDIIRKTCQKAWEAMDS
jgi:SOS response regulatory protein OraA/RecX